jgi:Ca-activated chloride channel family protein
MRIVVRSSLLLLARLSLILGWGACPTRAAADEAPVPRQAAPEIMQAATQEDAGPYTLRVAVNLVLVEATVRDKRGAIVDGLRREDFTVLENGVPQVITHFSQDELPLAVAIVVDCSSSVAPVVGKLREAALETLSLLKPGDEVALFEFDSAPRLLEVLTANRQYIAESIAAIQGGAGGTNINDSLLEAVRYLGSETPQRRHAVILVSDNIATYRSQASREDVVRASIATETTIYSIRITSSRISRQPLIPDALAGTMFVDRMANETGGEVFEANDGRSIRAAMDAVISRLKRRYTLGYVSSNPIPDGKFREITVQLRKDSPTAAQNHRIFARRGYYATLANASHHEP